ncbi:MAG TPA: LexA family transcriptional regulator [Candidatus Nosocomiicoccus stercorigallinarum]|nr:LexA family transcriptional regulator [Candidatus Nosocomiicoccus stercorigallinarum]
MAGNKEIMAKNINKYMKQSNMSRKDLSEKLKVGYTTVTDWVNAVTYPRIDKIEMLSNLWGIEKSDLIEDNSNINENNILPTNSIPVVSKISAGDPVNAEENIESYIAILNAKENTFGLIVNGDSMDKEFKDGDIVIVEKDAIVENGQIGVVHINGYNATVKRIKYNDDDIILIPESNNNEHVPKIFNRNDHIHIVGRVVGVYKQY